MKFFTRIVIFSLVFMLVNSPLAFAQTMPNVVAVEVEGNRQVDTNYILSIVGTKAGQPADREQIDKDVEAIYNLGFFSYVDVRVEPVADGIKVVYVVQENPVVKEIRFEGNEVYSEDELKELVFTKPGNIFNSVFFRHDLERIRNKYQDDGYAMMRVRDVQIEEGVITVKILEPKVGEIAVQGNEKTQTYVIEREIKLKPGDHFNAKVLRHSLNKLQRMGYFETVNVGFEPTQDPAFVNIIVSVEEQRTGRIGLTIGHGSSSGWSGGLSYEDTNWKGLGHTASVGFETGKRDQYWITYEEPFMDVDYYSWRVNLYRWEWDDIENYIGGESVFEYEETRTGISVGAGKKFKRDPRFSWYATLDWHDSDIPYDDIRWYSDFLIAAEEVRKTDTTGKYKDKTVEEIKRIYFDEHMQSGKTFSITGRLQRSTLDEYLSYPKGDVVSLNVEQALDFLGSDWDFTKYWLEARYYTPVTRIGEIFDIDLGTEDTPVIFAARVRAGFSSGEIPFMDHYFLGGDRDLRGYEEDEFYGTEMFLANFELRIPIEQAFGLVFFYDAGNAWGDSDPLIDQLYRTVGRGERRSSSFDLSDLHDSYGIGVRVRTPLGNLRIDLAEGEYETYTHFGFGELF
ncbi:BamA/OMP85 family outer membrane protein [Acetomicrobium hydrogeniformans]|uniref:Outer membrane protein, OMP85 family n=1 Tax=Acetomicrobium hydrogeniformans ATCC BAA-1850 TaxID=592015 RepID=A0A0T5XBB2_9BACT|nr:BamA/TamA family outer membrane protein [Acetomicrobium hydrogeniformans]KRT35648.1 outer membrane protein, OMP85 family [Acetomicrobium hydrogeniformans ATCC BAA-1850]